MIYPIKIGGCYFLQKVNTLFLWSGNLSTRKRPALTSNFIDDPSVGFFNSRVHSSFCLRFFGDYNVLQ